MPDLMAHFGAERWQDAAGLLEHFTAAGNPPCHYCHEPLDDEDIDNESSSHEECWDMHQCPVHGEHEDDPVLAEQHRDTYTDWYHHLPFAGGIHRGLVKQLPREVHDAVHDESRPSAERAQALRGYLHREGFHGGTQEEQPYGADHEGHLGVHWTPSETMAKSWGSDDMYEGPVGGGPKPSVTHVVLHAASPDEEHIETDPDHLEARHMYGFEHERSEHEVPLKYGAPVHLTGISWKHGGQEHWHRHDFAAPGRHMAAAGDPAVPEAFPNPYHPAFGGRPEFSHTWFHGTRGTDPDLRPGRPLEDQRGGESGRGWPQPNKLLGTHFSPLHRVAHGFAKGVYPSHVGEGSPGVGSALVHARLHMRDPAHFPTEKHLNIAVARFANDHFPGWHDDKLNANMAWQYSDSEGTHRDWHAEPHYDPAGKYEDNRDFHRLADKAQSILQWHPKLPHILHDFTDDLIRHGHHGITYGNEVEGPGQGSHDGEWDKEFAEHTYQDVRHISAIATRPSQIETTHVEHIAPPQTEPQPHEVEHHPVEPRYWGKHENFEHGKRGYASELNEDKPMYDRVGAFHAEHGGAYPGHVRTASAAALYHSGGRDFPGDEEWVHLGTREAALNRAKDWHEERARRGEPPAQAYLHTVALAGSRYPSERSDSEANDPVWRDITARSGHTVLPYANEYEDPGTVSYLAHRSAVSLLKTEPLPHGKQAKIIDMASSDGDEFYECAKGHDHWGAHGAAGLLIRHRGEDGQQRYLLQKRSPYSDEPDTWSVPGGAIGEHESPEDGAWREAREEMGSIPRHVTHHHTVTSTDCGDWQYHTVVADAGEHFMPRGNGETEYETAGVGWHTADEIEELRKGGDLHPAFAKSWDAVRRSRGPKTAAAEKYYHGTSDEYSPGDQIEHHYWKKYPDRADFRANTPLYTTTDPALGGYMADLRGGQGRGHLYEVRPGGPLKPDETANPVIRGASSWQVHDPLHVVREIPRHEWPQDLGSWQKTAAALYSQRVERIHPRDLLPYAQREAWRMQDPSGQRHISDLAEKIRQRGYQPRLHGGMSGDTHSYPPSQPITLVHDDENSWLWNGHHRTFALNEAGYDKPVPVLVKDFRTARTAVLHPDAPDYAHGMQSGGSQVEWVRREKLQPYMEFRHDRDTGESHYLPTGHRFPDRYNRQRWNEMDSSIAQHGMHEPILLEYNPWTRKMHIGEGHHRLESAERLGHEMVPVWGLKTSQEHAHAKPVPGEPKVRPEHFAGGYFPSSFKPSDVLPEHWMQSRAEREQDEWDHPKMAVITPGSLPPEQQAAFDADDHREHRTRMLEVARHPQPGTRVWRGEIRRNDEDPASAPSAGMHWSASPDPIITGWAPEGHKHVVWQGVVENHEEQAFPRSHPIWSGRHQSFDHEAEVRFRPGAQVKLEGAYVHQPKEYPGGLATTPGHLVPRVPERTHPDWKWHPLDRHITIRHAGQGASDYEHLGIPREAGRQLPVTEIGPLYHGTTQERAGRILEHGFEGGTVHLTPHADLAGSYAAGRVTKDKGGAPAVLKIERVRGVSASETGYMDPEKSRASGADYQDKGPEVVVLNPAAIHGITRHAAAGPFYHGTNAELAEGDQVRSSWREPRHEPGKIYPDQFFTTDTAEAARYGKNVYQVEPEGAYEPDESRPRSWLSRQPLRVIRRHAAADPAMVP